MKQKKLHLIHILLSFAVPGLVLFFSYSSIGVGPWLEKMNLTGDAFHQYLPFYAGVRSLLSPDRLRGFHLLGGLGHSFFGNYFYYQSGIGPILSVLFPLSVLPDVMFWLTLVKIGLSGLFFLFFLSYAYQDGNSNFYTVLFSCCYALMSYNIAYSLCIMWMDIVMLLPLVLLGCERVKRGKSTCFYIITLTLALYSDLYLACITCIFGLIYLIYTASLMEDRRKRFVIRILGSSVLSFGLAMPVIIPFIKLNQNGFLKATSTQDDGLFLASIGEVLRKLTGSQFDSLISGTPYIFAGTLSLVLILIFFADRKVKAKEKIIVALILVLYLCSFCIRPLDQVWHGFRSPNGFPYRYAFTFTAFILIVSFREIQYLCVRGFTSKDYYKVVTIGIGLFTAVELFLNTSYLVKSIDVVSPFKEREDYESFLADMEEMQLETLPKDQLYRIGKDFTYTFNDSFLMNVPELSYFSSYYYPETMDFVGKLGIPQNRHTVIGTGYTPVVDSLLGIRYLFYKSGEESELLEAIEGNGGTIKSYRNPYALSLGYLVYGDKIQMKKDFTDLTADVFLNQQVILQDFLGDDYLDPYHTLEVSEQYITNEDFPYCKELTIRVKDGGPLYLYTERIPKAEYSLWDDAFGVKADSFDIQGRLEVNLFTSSGGMSGYFITDMGTSCNYIGTFSPGETVSVMLYSTKKPFGLSHVVEMDLEAYRKDMELLKKGEWDLSGSSNHSLKGKIYADRDTNMILTLPPDQGFQVYVDGVKNEVDSYRQAMILVPIPQGEHIVELKYQLPGLELGFVLFVMALVLAFLWIKKIQYIDPKEKRDLKENE